ncbi:hypothetical protein N8T08_001743 [Aspergillus melleus]|uniref:Uncharacterized protein n=1 Tax=Aspergillus melleus TaxID=138277 RepID=A0ACC3AN83_9EURO|nr:hypothetical protein N8T08_001743 [Aspergillus melleus]
MTSIVPQPSQSQSTVSHPNMTCSFSSNTTAEHRPTVASRPKLTLQTTSLPRTFGTSSTGLSLSLAGGVTASPTVRNTFKNAYDAAIPSSATASPSKSSASRFSKPSSPYPLYAQNNSNTNNNPYQLPLGVKSILRNSPLEPTCRLATSATGSTGSRRVFFPAKKQVNYRQPLEEEIQTVHYTARHSDLSGEPEAEQQPPQTSSDQDSDSNSSLAPSDASTSDEDDSAAGTRRSPSSTLERKKRKHLSAEKQVRAVALMDGLEENYGSTTPQTPRQKRVKRRCEWRWTLGPLETHNEGVKPLPAQSETPSDLAITTTTTVPVLSNPVPKWVSKDVESPASASDLLSASSAASLPYSSPSSSVASEVADKNDEYWKTTSHEPERAHADPPE